MTPLNHRSLSLMSTARRKHQLEDEDAAALKLGSGMTLDLHSYCMWGLTPFAEFNNAGCLLISEVKYLLEVRQKEAPDTA